MVPRRLEPSDFDNSAFFEGHRSCAVTQKQVNAQLEEVLSALNEVKIILKKKIIELKIFLHKILSDVHKVKKIEQGGVMCDLLKVVLCFNNLFIFLSVLVGTTLK